MIKKIIKSLGVLSLFASPILALAQVPPAGTPIGGPTAFNLLATIGAILNFIIPLLIVIAVIWFIYGVLKYATAKDNEAQAEGRSVMINGIIALFVIVSIWGLVAVINSTFGINQGGPNVSDPQGCQLIGIDQFGNPIYPPGC